MTQSEARAEARRLNDSGQTPVGLCAVAVADPAESWGGHERGWQVAVVPTPSR